MNCFVCHKKLASYNKSGCCDIHFRNYSLKRTCKTCDIPIYNGNKQGFCKKHRDVTGINNSFYGKTHNIKTVNTLKRKNKIISENLWKNIDYRNRVISAVSKPRRAGFKEEQSIRIKEWYKNNPNQRKLRSAHMKKSWKLGKIQPGIRVSNSASKIEKRFFNDVQKFYGDDTKKITIKTLDGHWMFPDVVLIDIHYILEFFGDYWHANPDFYDAEDEIHPGITAKDIWKKDRKRINKLEDMGYTVLIIWEEDYKKDKETVLQSLNNYVNWDSCSF